MALAAKESVIDRDCGYLGGFKLVKRFDYFNFTSKNDCKEVINYLTFRHAPRFLGCILWQIVSIIDMLNISLSYKVR